MQNLTNYTNERDAIFISVSNNATNTTTRSNNGAILQTGEIIQLIIYLVILVVGCIGNALVILYFGFKKKVKQRFSHYLINLAFVDLLTSIFTPTNFIYSIISQHKWNIGLLSCIGLSSIGPLTVNVSAWIITSIAIERHRGIKNPLRQRYSRTRIYITMLCIWIISIATLIPYMMSLNINDHICRPEWRSAHTEFAYSLVLLVLQSILPAFMMVVMFISIYRAVTARGRFLSVHYKTPTAAVQSSLLRLQRNSSDERRNVMEKRDKKLFNMLTIALVIFIVCSIPYNIFYTTLLYLVRIQDIQYIQQSTSILSINVWLAMLVTINSCINFFIYAGVDKSFKAYCKSILYNKPVKDENCTQQETGRQSFISRLSINLDLETTPRRGSSVRLNNRRRSSTNHASLIQKISFPHEEYVNQISLKHTERLSPLPKD